MRKPRLMLLLVALVVSLTVMAPTQARAEEPAVVLQGPRAIGQYLFAVVTGIEGAVEHSWTLDGEPVAQTHLPNGTEVPVGRMFMLEEYLGKHIAVTVVVTPDSGEPVTLTDGPYEIGTGQALANGPTISGEARVGQTLTAVTQLIYPLTGVEESYEWYDAFTGTVIEGADERTLVLTEDLIDRSPRVAVTWRKQGWLDTRKTSRSVAPVISEEIPVPDIRIGQDPVALQEVTVHVEPARGTGHVTQEIAWRIDGVLIPGETQPSLMVRPDWAGRLLTAEVTLTRANGQNGTFSSSPHTVGLAALGHSTTIRHTQPIVGWPLRLSAPPLPPGATREVTWVRVDASGRETVIVGEHGAVYRMTAADIGSRIGARVVHRAPGFETHTSFSTTVAPVVFNVYTTPGEHEVNGRQWRTTCEPYSQTLRCRTEILATQVRLVGGNYVRHHGWVFNNLTYLPLAYGTWASNPLANDGGWTDAAGRQWLTECGMPNVGRDTCRTYIRTRVAEEHQPWKFRIVEKWVFNNMVYTA